MTELSPCPFCGGTDIIWLEKSMVFGTGASGMEPPMRALGCGNPKCMVKPATCWRDTGEWSREKGHYAVNYDAAAVADWNNRPSTGERAVKALEWKSYGDFEHSAKALGGHYIIMRRVPASGERFILHTMGRDMKAECSTLDEAKAAAQSDFTSRINSAISQTALEPERGTVTDEMVNAALIAQPFGQLTVGECLLMGRGTPNPPAFIRAALIAALEIKGGEDGE